MPHFGECHSVGAALLFNPQGAPKRKGKKREFMWMKGEKAVLSSHNLF